MLDVGKKIKNSTVLVADEKKIKIKQLTRKSGMVLYFYPRDNTPGCTTQAIHFRDNLKLIQKLGFSVVGVSADSLLSHQKFITKKELNFPLIADVDLELCNEFAVYGEKKFMGKTYMGINRSTFVLDSNLKIIKTYKKVKVKEHVAQIVADLKSL